MFRWDSKGFLEDALGMLHLLKFSYLMQGGLPPFWGYYSLLFWVKAFLKGDAAAAGSIPKVPSVSIIFSMSLIPHGGELWSYQYNMMTRGPFLLAVNIIRFPKLDAVICILSVSKHFIIVVYYRYGYFPDLLPFWIGVTLLV